VTALPLPDPPLREPLVALRGWCAADVPARVMLFADPSVLARSWPTDTPYTEHDARAFLAWQEQARLAGEALNLAFCAPGDQAQVLGGGSFYDVSLPSGRASIGYWLSPGARGRGVVTAAVRLLTGWGFEQLGLGRVELTCAPDNLASQAVAERCGFTREALLRSHMSFKGGRRDTVVYGLLASEGSPASHDSC
jgi:RimJ/RimL family protein N-acetyltransferase